MNYFIFMFVFLAGTAAAVVLGFEANLTILNLKWWLTVPLLCFCTGYTAGGISRSFK